MSVTNTVSFWNAAAISRKMNDPGKYRALSSDFESSRSSCCKVSSRAFVFGATADDVLRLSKNAPAPNNARLMDPWRRCKRISWARAAIDLPTCARALQRVRALCARNRGNGTMDAEGRMAHKLSHMRAATRGSTCRRGIVEINRRRDFSRHLC